MDHSTVKTLAIPKAPTWVPGFDSISYGGLPRARTTLVTGNAGAGKTIFALQSLVGGAREGGEAGIFVAFEESARRVVSNAATFGWDIPALEKESLIFVDASLSAEMVKTGAFDLAGMLAILKHKAAELRATRIVFDGIDVLLSVLNDVESEQRELLRVKDWIHETGLTAIITSKIEARYPRPYFMLQYMVDCVVTIQNEVKLGVLHRSLRVSKYRGSSFHAQESPLAITSTGIKLLDSISDERPWLVSSEKVSSGISRLDTMLLGGYYRGTSTLISGAPGTAKSTLAGIFADAACRRKEKTLLVSFEEPFQQLERNMRSVGVQLAPHVTSRMLHSYATRTQAVRAVDHLLSVREAIDKLHIRNLVIDPISAMRQSSSRSVFASTALYLLDFAKTKGISVMATTLTEEGDTLAESRTGGISSAVDTWIHLSYVVQDGERNRGLTIVKSRGVGHSNQVRELLLSDRGVTLANAYTSDGKLLMGVARWEKEVTEGEEQEALMAQADLKQRQMELALAEGEAKLATLKREVETKAAELRVHELKTRAQSKVRDANRAHLYHLRRGDDKPRPNGKPHGKDAP